MVVSGRDSVYERPGDAVKAAEVPFFEQEIVSRFWQTWRELFRRIEDNSR